MKKIITAAVCVILVFAVLFSVPVSANEKSGIEVLVNGVVISFDQEPVIVEGRTMVPLRAIFEQLGATVEWDDATKTVTSTKDEIVIKLTINDTVLYRNGEAIALDVPAQIVNSRTLVPARAVAESFGARVAWNEDARYVAISTDNLANSALLAFENAGDYSYTASVNLVYQGMAVEFSEYLGVDLFYNIDVYGIKLSTESETAASYIARSKEEIYSVDTDGQVTRTNGTADFVATSVISPYVALRLESETETEATYVVIASTTAENMFKIVVNKQTGMPCRMIVKKEALAQATGINGEFEADLIATFEFNTGMVKMHWDSIKDLYTE